MQILRYKADIRTLLFVGLYFVAAITPWVLKPQKWYVILFFIILISVLSFLCTIIVHNTVHVPIFRQKAWNKVFQVVLTLAHGNPVSGFVPGHNLSHHKFPQTSKDSASTFKARFKWNLLNQILFFPLVIKDVAAGERRFVLKMWKIKKSWSRQYLLEFVIMILVKGTLLIYNWEYALYFVFIPHLYAIWGIFGVNFWQHDGCDENSEYNHSRNITSPVFNFFGFNNGFHTVHHIKPGLHWSLCPEVHYKEVHPFIHPNLEQKSLIVYLWKTMIWPGKRVNYLGNPMPVPLPFKSEDWVKEVVISGESAFELGAESLDPQIL